MAEGTLKYYDGSNWKKLNADRTATRIVAAHDADEKSKAGADYVCDGTDDQVEINNAINALPATGGEIVILDGTYNITAKINVNKDNVSIKGNGNATILKRGWDSVSAEGVITLTSVEGCRIESLQIDGNKAVYTSNKSYGIYLHSSSNENTITGNTCNNNNYYGIYLYLSSNENTVTGNTCNNNGYGIGLGSSSNENTVTGNTCNNNNNSGIFLSSSSNNTITGNTCNNNNNYYGINLFSSSNNTVTGNTCNNNNCGINLYLSDNNNVTGNTCIRGTGQTNDYIASQYTIQLSDTSNNYNLISSNNCMGKAVSVGGGTGNTVFNNKYDESSDFETHLSEYPNHGNLKNKLINGNFDVWQRGTSFDNILFNSYTADRWTTGDPLGATQSVFRQEFSPGDIPGKSTYFLRFTRTVAATASNTMLSQFIENVRTLAGKKATLSFYAKANKSKTLGVRLYQNFGSGGSSVVLLTGQTMALTTSWQKFTFTFDIPSIAGKTLGSGHLLALQVYENSGFSTFVLDIAQVQLEEGEYATPFEQRPIGLEKMLCGIVDNNTFGAIDLQESHKSHLSEEATDAHLPLNVGLGNVDNYKQARSLDGYVIVKNGSDSNGNINFKT